MPSKTRKRTASQGRRHYARGRASTNVKKAAAVAGEILNKVVQKKKVPEGKLKTLRKYIRHCNNNHGAYVLAHSCVSPSSFFTRRSKDNASAIVRDIDKKNWAKNRKQWDKKLKKSGKSRKYGTNLKIY